METAHRVVTGDARELDLPDDSVELVVTSPPYPMIDLWDDLFGDLDPGVETALEAGDGATAFERMHAVLDTVWAELERVLVEGGIACVNVGDATRTLDGRFRVYHNHARIVERFDALGFDPLPDVVWRKPTNSAAKFMGSGMIPPNAYTTLEHEYVLVFRNGEPRAFDPGSTRRYESAYFWEERNRWFSDVWTDLVGERQALEHDRLRERSGAFPVELPYRLITMYSVFGDTVLDPFWGTGSTAVAAMLTARNSVGYELQPDFVDVFDERLEEVPSLSQRVVDERLEAHRTFVEAEHEAGRTLEYDAEHYDFPVRTKQERRIRLYAVESVEEAGEEYRTVHEPV